MRRLLYGGAPIAVLAFGGCAQAPAPAAAKLWTVFDVEALYAGGAPATKGLAPADGLPGGVLLGNIAAAADPPAGPTLIVRTGLADGYQVKYETTEVWSNYDQVWTQPAYVPITGFAGGVPQKVVDAGGAWHPIFSVGPGSGFYSPFWQLVYVTVPAGTTTDTFTSARQILDGGYPLTPGPGQTMPLVPDMTAGGGKPGVGWLDGSPISFLNFGGATFTWDPVTNVVGEVPIYYLTVTGADGAPHVLPSVPQVLGTSPPGLVPAPAPTLAGSPRYSAYWRLYTVAVPPTARVFAPPGSAAEADLVAIGVDPGTYPPSLFADPFGPAYYAPFVGMVAANPECFANPDLLEHADSNPATCTWLDRQATLEANVDPSANVATGLTVTCPVIAFKGAPVVPL